MKKFNVRSPYFGWAVLGIMLILYLASFYQRMSNDDEGMIAEWGYRLLENGHASSSIVEPLGLGFEDRISVYHKLVAWLAVPVIAIFGMNPFMLKLLAFPFFLLLLFVGYKLTCSDKSKALSPLFVLFLVIFSLNAVVFEFAFTFRPEIILAAFGFTGFYFIYRATISKNNGYAALGGLFSALAMLAHLNGITYLMAGFVILLSRKHLKLLLWYSIAGGLISLLYFADMTDLNIIEAIQHDLLNSPDVKSTKLTFWSPFVKLLNEHQRFFHSPDEIVFSITFISCLLLASRAFFRKNMFLFKYTLLLIVFLGCLSSTKTPKYIIVYYPFMALIMAMSLNEFYLQRKSLIKHITTLLFVCFFFIQAYHITIIFNKSCNLMALNNKVFDHVPKGSRILGHSNLMFGGISNYTIHSSLNYNWTLKPGIEDTFEEYLRFGENNNEEYVVITRYFTPEKYLNEINFDDLKVSQRFDSYIISYVDSDLAIFKLIENKLSTVKLSY